MHANYSFDNVNTGDVAHRARERRREREKERKRERKREREMEMEIHIHIHTQNKEVGLLHLESILECFG